MAAAVLAAPSGSTAPDEPLIAFAGVHWTAGSAPGGSQVFVIRADGVGRRPLTLLASREDAEPAWSPDGRRIAFARRDSGGWRLMVMDAAGGRLRALTGRQPLADAPAWSPDGRKLAFAGLPSGLPRSGSFAQQIYVVPSGGGRPRQLTGFAAFPGGTGGPAWSPDGKLLLFWCLTSLADNAGSDVWIVRADGSHARRLLAKAMDPAWSPDGRRIAFVRRDDLYTANADGTGGRRLMRTAAAEAHPSWSPDGLRIAFSRRSGETQRLFVVGAEGTGFRALTKADPRFWAASPVWQPGADR